ncbi:cation-transporting P-type ATPase [Legionella jordanis]|uniref:Cation efflux transporter n=1 Tax=Legionella jordanis TaxID=456 RepID=A0A0W0VEB0_9GAMM|nr:cation-transporting P-type ATPase [Legionella jordanis]KTD18458.1 cation efflux transporter [Legionella jordanis]RMX05363.1 cation-transporting P-type ATPase [Legionella jordanis]RMX20789.1 cation-transporting P-type ATPase [Legionella jordanis]VEH13194.1 cation efflux transporter [Legionella jordanis]
MADPQNSYSEPYWHELSTETILKTLNSSEFGLSEEESQRRLKDYGPNRLAEPKRKSTVFRFVLQFHNILIYVLLAAALVTSFLQHWMDTAIILAVVVINALIGIIQEGKAEKALDAIRKILPSTAAVIRNGERIRIPGEKLVPGDIIFLEAGDKVPADVRLIKSHGLTIQESILTGESVPVEKTIHPVSRDAPLGDRTCMAFSGTLVTNGLGKGIVVETGSTTQIGYIGGLLSKVESLTTPLIIQMGLFAKWLTLFILFIASILLAYGYFVQHHPFAELFMVVVGLSVAAIPEGLPAVLSITLAIGVQAMARRHTIVRRLPAIETLGSVSVICTDKTGTLTQNEMIVSSVLTSNHLFSLDGIGYEPQGKITLKGQVIDNNEHPLLMKLARAALLCNDAALHEQEGNWIVEGDPMEGALLAFAAKAGLILYEEKKSWVRTDVIPFDAQHRFMATLNHDHLKHALIFVKGAPEQILKMCQNQQSQGSDVESLDKMYWEEKMEEMASGGQRVLAVAVKKTNPEHTVLECSDVQGSLTLLGMVGLIDPPRPESILAVAQCHAAGIAVKMITGDHASTALAIGRQIGLKNADKVLTGVDLDDMSDAILRHVVLDSNIFARASPEHKLRLVMALQSNGMTVAMTGDGVNDAPALKRADAGIAMGKKGSEVAKEAAEFILTDDNFASIVAAVREGRTVYDNLKKVISWTLPTNAGEAMTIILALLLGLRLPVTAIQILWVNLITAVTLGIALAFEPTEEGTMHRPPRLRCEPLLTGSLVWHIIFVSTLFIFSVFGIYFYALDRGYSLELARTIALNTLVVLEVFHLFYIRNIYSTSLTWKAVRGTKVVWMAVIVIVVAQLSITYFPPLQTVFVTESIPFMDGVLIVTTGALFFIVIEIEKQLRFRVLAISHIRAGENTLNKD